MQSPKLLVWRRVFDKAYQGEGAQDGPTAVSWNSSYTGQPIPRDEMDEYFVHTIARIQALQPQLALLQSHPLQVFAYSHAGAPPFACVIPVCQPS